MEGSYEPSFIEETMRTAILTILGAAMVVFGWQRTTITELRTIELRASAPRLEQRLSETSAAEDSAPQNSGMSDAEFATIIETLREFRAVIAAQKAEPKGGDSAVEKERVALINRLPRILVQLSPDQLNLALEVWTAGGPVMDELVENKNGLSIFAAYAAGVSPDTLIQAIQTHPWEVKGNSGGYFATAFQAWVRKDAEGMLAWVRSTKVDPSLAEVSAVWTEAAEAILDPSPENVRKLLARSKGPTDPNKPTDTARIEVVRGLRSQDARIQFFRSLHEASGGTYDHLRGLVVPLAERLPFSQLAHIADSVPALKPIPKETADARLFWMRLPSSLRYEVAAACRDATPQQRWEWLTSRADDVPTGSRLRDLVGSWCANNHAETGTWARTQTPVE